MRLKSEAFARYRPRVLTLIVLFAVAASTVLANLSPNDFSYGYGTGPVNDLEYGWPLIWYWRNYVAKVGGTGFAWQVVRYRWPRLAGNLAMGAVMLAVAGTVCEWLVRRYRPRLRWSLRTMLAATAILAVLCAWCAVLRNRANLQDPIIAEIEGTQGMVYLERWGPKWLDLAGADRFRRRIVGVWCFRNRIQMAHKGMSDEELLTRISQLPELRHLCFYVRELTPGMAAALGDMRELRSLRFHDADAITYATGSDDAMDDGDDEQSDVADDGEEPSDDEDLQAKEANEGDDEPSDDMEADEDERWDDGERFSDEVLAAIGKLKLLKVLHMSGMTFTSDSLSHLPSLTDLRSLRLEFPRSHEDIPELERLASIGKLGTLANLPALPRLETIGFRGGLVRGKDLRQLAAFDGLKALDLTHAIVTDATLAELASLESLEELAIDDEVASAAVLESLVALKRLQALHISSNQIDHTLAWLPLDKGEMRVRKSEFDRCRQALEALRQSNPGIVVDDDPMWLERRVQGDLGRELLGVTNPQASRWPPGSGIF